MASKSAPSERYDTTVRRGARAGWAIGAEAGEAADQRHASPVDFFFWGVPATAASPKACMYPCPAAPLRLWPLLTVPLRPRYATAIGPVPPPSTSTQFSYWWSTVRVLRAHSLFGLSCYSVNSAHVRELASISQPASLDERADSRLERKSIMRFYLVRE